MSNVRSLENVTRRCVFTGSASRSSVYAGSVDRSCVYAGNVERECLVPPTEPIVTGYIVEGADYVVEDGSRMTDT